MTKWVSMWYIQVRPKPINLSFLPLAIWARPGSEPTPQAALAAGFQINALACATYYLSRDNLKHTFPRVFLCLRAD
jgi:hypothetical protein